MASTIAAITTSGGGVVTTADSSGNLSLLSGATTVVAVTSTGATVTGTLAATGAVSGTTGTFTSTLGVTGAITGSSTVAGSTGILYPLTSGTAVASTSGTSIDFTGIPSWVKRITVMLNGVSTNSTSKLVVRIGTGGTPTTSGYIAQTTIAYSSVSTSPETTGFPIFYDTASFTISGSMVIQNITGNNWVMSAVGSNAGGTAFNWFSGGNVSLAGVLNLVRLTTVNGTDTFDAGSVNLLYE